MNKSNYIYKINSVKTRSNESFSPGKINVFVGANNCGKTQMLKDILTYITGSKAQTVVLEELEECLPSDNTIEKETEYDELVEHLNNFLKTIPTDKRKIFLDRYWNLSSIKDISYKNKMKESNVKVTLHRLRNELKDYLVKRGVVI